MVSGSGSLRPIPNVLGRHIELAQRQYTVIGVLPKTVQYPSDADVFLPFAATPQQLADRQGRDYTGDRQAA